MTVKTESSSSSGPATMCTEHQQDVMFNYCAGVPELEFMSWCSLRNPRNSISINHRTRFGYQRMTSGSHRQVLKTIEMGLYGTLHMAWHGVHAYVQYRFSSAAVESLDKRYTHHKTCWCTETDHQNLLLTSSVNVPSTRYHWLGWPDGLELSICLLPLYLTSLPFHFHWCHSGVVTTEGLSQDLGKSMTSKTLPA